MLFLPIIFKTIAIKKNILIIAIIVASIFIEACKKKEEHLPVRLKFDIENPCCNLGGKIRTINSTTNADTHTWDFGDGSSSTEFEPMHEYGEPEAYNVSYTAMHSGSGEKTSLSKVVVVSDHDGFVYDTVDSQPEYKGGWTKYYEFLDYVLQYPQDAIEREIEGTVIIKFTVSRFVTVECEEIYEGVHNLLDEPTLECFKVMRNWEKPAYLNGEAVSFDFYQSIHFKYDKSHKGQIETKIIIDKPSMYKK